jgi:hypothetical protein
LMLKVSISVATNLSFPTKVSARDANDQSRSPTYVCECEEICVYTYVCECEEICVHLPACIPSATATAANGLGTDKGFLEPII